MKSRPVLIVIAFSSLIANAQTLPYSGSTSTSGIAFTVTNTNTTDFSPGAIYGVSTSPVGGFGVEGAADKGAGVYGDSSQGTGVYGHSTRGIYAGFFTNSSSIGLYAYGPDAGAVIETQTAGKNGLEVSAHTLDSGANAGIHTIGDKYGIYAETLASSAAVAAVRGVSKGIGGNFISTNNIGMQAQSDTTYGVWGASGSTSAPGVYGGNSSNGSWADGVFGASTYGHGVVGTTHSSSLASVFGENDYSGYGVSGFTNSNGVAIYGDNTCNGSGCTGFAGLFTGRVHVNGTLSKSAGSFKIDHPLAPTTKYLSHSFVESPDMKNIYDGIVTVGADGTADVTMPDWFEALNEEFRYQLTCVGGYSPVFVQSEIANGHFKIGGGRPGLKVSWQVTGIRHDAYAKSNPIVVEEPKEPQAVGRYLNPESFGKSRSLAIVQPSTSVLEK
ncbi:MAG: hypothetical protein K1X89_05700 [Myxococcaceae bacterium]|nr:hypothetical protein [Myxococcaceae bacterium]